MVDRESRNKLAELLRRLGSGRITVGEFMDAAPWDSPDRGVQAVLVRVDAEYIPLRSEMLDAPLKLETRYADDFAMLPEQRRQIAEMILFLHSNLEYSYRIREAAAFAVNSAMRWILVSAAVFLLLYALSCFLDLTIVRSAVIVTGWVCLALLALTVLMAVISILVIFFASIATREDVRFWPFTCRRDYNAAIANPKLLTGRRR